MKMTTSLVVAMGLGISASCFAGERDTKRRLVKPSREYSSVVLDKDTTITIVSDADGNMIDAQMLQVDGEEAVTVSIMAKRDYKLKSIDTTLKYDHLLLDDGLTATMITDADGNLIGATMVLVSSENLISSSASDDNIILAMDHVRILSSGNRHVVIRQNENTGIWQPEEILNYPYVDAGKRTTMTKSQCAIAIAVTGPCDAVGISTSCDGAVTVYTLCRRSVGGNQCSGDWYVCGVRIYNG